MDYYRLLGIAREASEADIKTAYRRLAMINHPDHNNGDKGAEERFKQITEAYEVLCDERQRAAYDHPSRGRQWIHVVEPRPHGHRGKWRRLNHSWH